MSGFKVNFSVNNQLATPSIHAAPFAQRPAAGQPGRVFIDSDNPSTGIYRDTGTTWVVIGMPSSPEADTLQIVTGRGNTTTNSITVGAATSPVGTIDVRRTTAALNGANDWALVSVNSPTIASGASFGVNYVNAVYGSQALTFSGNATIGNTGINAAGNFINSLGNNASGTITVAQGSGTIRAIAGVQAGIYYNTPNAMTFTHVAGIKTLQPINSGAVGASVTNYYGVHIADSTPSSGTISYTNRWGIYQEGTSDINYFGGKTLINRTTFNTPSWIVLDVAGAAQIGSYLTIGEFNNVTAGPSLNMRCTAGSFSDIQFFNGGSGTVRMRVDGSVMQMNTPGGIRFNQAQNETNETMRIGTNVLIGTTTDSGQKLQVNGSTIIGTTLEVSNSGATYFPVIFGNTTNSESRVLLRSTSLQELIASSGPSLRWQSGNLRIDGTQNTTNKVIVTTANGASTFFAVWYNGGETEIGSSAGVLPTKAILTLNSTTKGFLPPRMTDAQITAITTPPAGLMAYSTDQNTLAFYDGTGWRKVSHSAL